LLLLILLQSTADDASYLSNWFTPYPYSTTLHLNLWQRFVNGFVIPAQIVASMWQPLQQLNTVKQQCGIKLHQGSPVTRHKHALKIINSFFGFEVGCDKVIMRVCSCAVTDFANLFGKSLHVAGSLCLCKQLQVDIASGPFCLVIGQCLSGLTDNLYHYYSCGWCACSRHVQ
jgi:hypothetical protein